MFKVADTFDKEIIKYISYLLQNNKDNLNLILCQPTFEKLGCLGITANETITLNFNDKTPLSFKYNKYVFDYNKGDYIKQLLYDEIERHRLIRFAGVGWFYIEEVEEYSDGVEKYKTVTCYSYEHLLTHRSVNLWSDLQSDDSTMTVSLKDILVQLKKQTGWNIPDNISSPTQDYIKLMKSINIEPNTSWYNFLIETVQKEFDIKIFFNYRDLIVDAKYSDASDYLRESNLILSFDNFMKNITITENSQKCASALYVKGNDVGISDVNPLGSNIIYNFDYYKNENWMSQDLITALNKWEDKITKYQEQYTYLCGFRNYLLELQTEYETELKELDTEVQKCSDILSSKSKSSDGGLNSKSGENYKTAINRKNLLEYDLESLNKALQLFYKRHDNATVSNDFVMMLGGLYSDVIPRGRIFMNSNVNSVMFPRAYRYTNTYDEKNGLVNKTYHYSQYFNFSAGSWLTINNNYYGQKLIELHNKGEIINTLADFKMGLSWKNNFTTQQLEELSKFIIDASYDNSDTTYLNYDSYYNYIDYYDVQLGSPQTSSAKDVSNPNDPFTYGVGYWTTNFIQLPDNAHLENEYKTFLYFYNRETGEKLTPTKVALYPTSENVTSMLLYTGVNGLEQISYDNVEYKYCRASFPYDSNNSNNAVPIRMVSATIGEKYKNNVKCNIDIETELYTTAKRIHKELIEPCKSFSVNLANFLSLNEFVDFANNIQLGAKLLAEIEPNQFINMRFLSMPIDFENIENLSLEFANKYNKYSDVLMFRKLIGSVSDTFDIQNSFNSFDLTTNVPILPTIGNPEYIPNTSGIIGDVDIPSTTDDNIIEIENEFEIIQDVDISDVIEIENEFEIVTGEKIEMEV